MPRGFALVRARAGSKIPINKATSPRTTNSSTAEKALLVGWVFIVKESTGVESRWFEFGKLHGVSQWTLPGRFRLPKECFRTVRADLPSIVWGCLSER